jgi:AAA family ATP:ADP antiporter
MATGAEEKPPSLIGRLLAVQPGERRALVWSFVYFFTLLFSYYILRPVREEMAIQGGTENIPWLFLATFIAMLAAVPIFGWLTSRYSRAQFLPWVYLFFAANLLLFFAAFRLLPGDHWTARVFFVWLSVFNQFVVSVFWAFMADLYNREQARRLFGMIAAGGSTGALAGPACTALLVPYVGPQNLLPISATMLSFSVVCIFRLRRWAMTEARPGDRRPERPLGGGLFEAVPLLLQSPYLLAISAMMLLGNLTGTYLYIYQAQVVSAAFEDSGVRTAVFAGLDLAVNLTALFFQVAVARVAIQRLGEGLTLAIVPALSIVGFLVLALHPALAALVVFQVLRRAANYGLGRPAKELLFTVVPVRVKYKAKSFIDTVIYRGGDALSAQAIRVLQASGASFGAMAMVCAGLCAVWVGLALLLGKAYGRRYESVPSTRGLPAAARALS